MKVTNNSETGVGGLSVVFTVVDTAGAETAATQIRLRAAQGAGATQTTLTRTTAAAGADQGEASVFVTRIAAGGGVPANVVSRIKIAVPVNAAAGGPAAGAQFPQEFTVPTR